MRTGVAGSMLVNDLTRGGVEMAALIKKSGYDYIELSLSHLNALSLNELKDIKEALNTLDLPCESCNNFFPAEIKLTGSNVNKQLIKDHVSSALSKAAYLGTEVVVFGSGPAKYVPKGFSIDKAYEQLVEICKLIGPIACENNITIAIEPLRKEECNIINTFSEGVKLATDSNEEAVKVLVDYYHLMSEKENPEILVTHKPFLKHVHFAKFEGRKFPIHQYEDPGYVPFFSALAKAEYNGRLTIEAYSSDIKNDLRYGINFIKAITDRIRE